MKFATFSLCCFFLAAAGSSEGSGTFCYNEDSCGQTTWSGKCQTGQAQSPINLEHTLDNIAYSVKTKLYTNSQYTSNQNFICENNGHTVQVKIRDDLTSTSVLTGNMLNTDYVFSQLHFHWGESNGVGSEHTLNGKASSMEGHFVHYAKNYTSLTEAINSGEPGAVTVLGVLYKVRDYENEYLNPILAAMEKTKNTNDTTEGTGLNLLKLIPGQVDGKKIYILQYKGSLTTPGCAEVVLWNVLLQPSYLSQKQMDKFRALSDSHGKPLVDNFRDIQALHGRSIKYYYAKIN